MLLSSISWKERNTAQELAPLTHASQCHLQWKTFLICFPILGSSVLLTLLLQWGQLDARNLIC